MAASLSESRLEVASSRIRMRGSARIARAIETRWRCPPESFTPRSPMIVSYFSGKRSANSSTRAIGIEAHGGQIHAVHDHAPLKRHMKRRHESNHRGFPRAGRTHEGRHGP